MQPDPTKCAESQEVGPLALALLVPGKARDLLKERIQFGKDKYGTTLMTHNGRDAFQDFLEEMLDGVQYISQCVLEGQIVQEGDLRSAYELLGCIRAALDSVETDK